MNYINEDLQRSNYPAYDFKNKTAFCPEPTKTAGSELPTPTNGSTALKIGPSVYGVYMHNVRNYVGCGGNAMVVHDNVQDLEMDDVVNQVNCSETQSKPQQPQQ